MPISADSFALLEFGEQLSTDFLDYCQTGIPTRVLSAYLAAMESLSGFYRDHHGQHKARIWTRLLKAVTILGEQSVQYSQQIAQIAFKIW